MNVDTCWIAGCGGTEQPFKAQGKTYLYMWNWCTKEHSYYCQTDDVFVSDIPRYLGARDYLINSKPKIKNN